jgi:hypothetical protein
MIALRERPAGEAAEPRSGGAGEPGSRGEEELGSLSELLFILAFYLPFAI